MYGLTQGTLSAKAQAKREQDQEEAFIAPRPMPAASVQVNVIRKRVNAPASAEQIAAAERKRASMPQRQQASAAERAPADPYVWATVTTPTGVYSAEMRASASDALRATGATVAVRDERPRSQGIPAYVPPPAATRSQNYNRFTGWQKVENTRVHFSRG